MTSLAAVALALPSPARATPAWGQAAAATTTTLGRLVVNEVAPSVEFWPVEEFLELRNTGDQVVALGGWELVACLSPTTWRVVARFPAGAQVSPGGYVLLTHPSYANPIGPSPDYHYTLEMPSDGGWLLLDRRSGYTDGVGLQNGLDCTEGDPAPQCDWVAGEAATRDDLGTDTDDNSVDFTCQPRTPGF